MWSKILASLAFETDTQGAISSIIDSVESKNLIRTELALTSGEENMNFINQALKALTYRARSYLLLRKTRKWQDFWQSFGQEGTTGFIATDVRASLEEAGIFGP